MRRAAIGGFRDLHPTVVAGVIASLLGSIPVATSCRPTPLAVAGGFAQCPRQLAFIDAPTRNNGARSNVAADQDPLRGSV